MGPVTVALRYISISNIPDVKNRGTSDRGHQGNCCLRVGAGVEDESRNASARTNI